MKGTAAPAGLGPSSRGGGQVLSSCVQVSPVGVPYQQGGSGRGASGFGAQGGPCGAGGEASRCAVLRAETVIILKHKDRNMTFNQSPALGKLP